MGRWADQQVQKYWSLDLGESPKVRQSFLRTRATLFHIFDIRAMQTNATVRSNPNLDDYNKKEITTRGGDAGALEP